MSWEAAFGLATSIGLVFGMIMRAIPSLSNSLVPKLTWIANVILNLALVVTKFLDAAGIEHARASTSGIALASFWGDAGAIFAKAAAAAVLAFASLLIQRLIHEKAIKPVLYPKSATLKGGF